MRNYSATSGTKRNCAPLWANNNSGSAKVGKNCKNVVSNSLSRAMTWSRALDCTRWSASAAGFFSAGCHYAKALTRGAPHTDARAPGWGVDDWPHRALFLIKSWPAGRVCKEILWWDHQSALDWPRAVWGKRSCPENTLLQYFINLKWSPLIPPRATPRTSGK